MTDDVIYDRVMIHVSTSWDEHPGGERAGTRCAGKERRAGKVCGSDGVQVREAAWSVSRRHLALPPNGGKGRRSCRGNNASGCAPPGGRLHPGGAGQLHEQATSARRVSIVNALAYLKLGCVAGRHETNVARVSTVAPTRQELFCAHARGRGREHAVSVLRAS